MKKVLFLLLILLIASNYLKSQIFPNDYMDFIDDFADHLKNTMEFRKNSKSMDKEFTTFWLSDTLDEKMRKDFIDMANLMSSKGCADYPDFVLLADNLLSFKRTRIDDQQYENYQTGLKKMLTKGKRPDLKSVSEYFRSVHELIVNDIVQKNLRTYWKVENSVFKIRYDKELKIDFENVNLIGYQDKDSVKIYNTNGTYCPETKLWYGNDGMVYWERVGFDQDKIHAKLQDYKIDLKNISFVADSVFFQNTMYFKEDLMGKLQDKAQNLDNPSKSDFPIFNSYKQYFTIKDIIPGIDYEGGFTVRGRFFIGTGTKEKYAKLSIYKNDTIGFVAESQAFYFDLNMLSTICRATLHIGNDSIYHPYLRLQFRPNERKLELIRTKDDFSKISYFNSYHNIYMDFTWFQWTIDDEKILFNTISVQKDSKEAAFESVNYYREERYKQIKKRDEKFPLDVISDFVKANNGKSVFHLNELSSYLRYPSSQILSMVMNLAYLGFVNFDGDTQMITVNETTWNFLEFHYKTKDSDVIQFSSRVSADKTNAELSLLNFDLKIYGIPEVHLSDSQNVQIYPKDNVITLKKDCSFTFDGVIKASQFYFYGSNFKFDYNQFLIELNNCDSMKMVAETDILDAKGNKTPAIVRNKLEQINGQFFIDAPANKSGRFKYKEYPQFSSLNKTYVYFDRPDIYNKIYDRERFYFEVDPFKLVGIKGYDPNNLVFGGRLVSAGIFPTIEDTLVLRKSDWSLGFNMKTTAAGLPLYEGKAHYYNEIDLSNKGLRGSGKIDYLTSKIDGDYLLFFPDQMTGHAEKVDIKSQKSGTQFPQATGKNNKLNWLVSKDKFNILRDSIDFNMYDGKAVASGDLVLASSGLTGNGYVTIDNARLTSKNFDYKHHEILSDTSDFALFTENILNLDFISKNVNSHVDFDKKQGKFIANNETTEWRFPKNDYISQMKEMTWHIDKKELEVNAAQNIASEAKTYDAMENPKGWEDLFMIEGPKFTSTHYKQDSLYFFSPRIIFDYDSLILSAEDVKFLNVADAQIFTNNQNLVVEQEAVIRPLKKAIIVNDSIERHHKIYDSYAEIYSKNNYSGKGYYDYLDAVDKIQKIYFDTVYVTKDGASRAKGTVTEDVNFSFSPHFKFFGDVHLYADNKIFEFDGASSIVNTCDTAMPNWVKFRSYIDPKDIYIPIDSNLYSINKFRLLNGLVYSTTNTVTPHFLKKRGNQYDQEIMTAKGFLTYNEEENSYIIASKEKINNPDTVDNIVKFNKFDCIQSGEGDVVLSRDFGAFKTNAYGKYEITPQTDTVSINLTMVLDAYFSSEAEKRMATVINSVGGLNPLDLRSDNYEKAIYRYLGQRDADAWYANIGLGNFNRQPSQLDDKFVFTDINMFWDRKFNSFLSYCPIGIANIGTNQVNKMVPAFIRIEKTRRGDIFDMLIEVDVETWFYFRYSNGFFFALSSDESFNNIVYNANDKNRKGEGPVYQYGMGSSVNMKRFKEAMYKYFKITQ